MQKTYLTISFLFINHLGNCSSTESVTSLLASQPTIMKSVVPSTLTVSTDENTTLPISSSAARIPTSSSGRKGPSNMGSSSSLSTPVHGSGGGRGDSSTVEDNASEGTGFTSASRITKESRDYKTMYKMSQASYNSKRTELAEAQSLITTLNDINIQLRNEIATASSLYQIELETKNALLTSLHASVSSLSKEIAVLRSQFLAAQEAAANAHAENAGLLTRISVTEEALETERQRVAQLTVEARTAAEDLTQLRSALIAVETRTDQKAAEKAVLLSRAEAAEQARDTLQTTLTTTQAAVNSTTLENSALSTTIISKDLEISRLREELLTIRASQNQMNNEHTKVSINSSSPRAKLLSPEGEEKKSSWCVIM